MLDPSNYWLYISAFAGFLAGGFVWFLACGWWNAAPKNLITFGRDMFGAGIFFFFFAIVFVVGYAALNIDDVFEKNGDLVVNKIKDNFTLGLFVALRETGTAIGIALGFLSLAWGRFFEQSNKDQSVGKTRRNQRSDVATLLKINRILARSPTRNRKSAVRR